MRFSCALVLALASAMTASAAPTKRQTAVTDADILQYALTLEHLENAFYKEALSKWPVEAFTAANFSPFFYDQLKYIAHDEEAHVKYLEAGLTAAGATPVAACEYKFGLTTPKAFVQTAAVVEGLGVSAYLGAGPFVTSKAYLTAAASILVVEALHQSAQRNAIGQIPMANPFGTPLGFNAVYSIASTFITSCPSSNAPLPVSAYPALTLKSGLPTAPNATVELTPAEAVSGTFFATFVSGLDAIAVADASYTNGMVMAVVPATSSGQSYVFLTKDNTGSLADSNIIAGPAIIEVTPDAPTFDVSIK